MDAGLRQGVYSGGSQPACQHMVKNKREKITAVQQTGCTATKQRPVKRLLAISQKQWYL